MSGLITEDLELRGDVTITGSFYPPAGSLTTSHWSSSTGDRLAASKVVHQFPVGVELAEQNTTVTAVEKLIHVVRGASGTIVGFEAVCVTVPTGDYTITVDLQKASSGGSFSSVLTSPITINSSSSNLTAVAATLSSTSLTDGDVLKIVVTVSGTSGTQGKGLIAVLTMNEAPT